MLTGAGWERQQPVTRLIIARASRGALSQAPAARSRRATAKAARSRRLAAAPPTERREGRAEEEGERGVGESLRAEAGDERYGKHAPVVTSLIANKNLNRWRS